MRIRVKIRKFEGDELAPAEQVRFMREVERRLARMMDGKRPLPPGEFGAAPEAAARQAFEQTQKRFEGGGN